MRLPGLNNGKEAITPRLQNQCKPYYASRLITVTYNIAVI